MLPRYALPVSKVELARVLGISPCAVSNACRRRAAPLSWFVHLLAEGWSVEALADLPWAAEHQRAVGKVLRRVRASDGQEKAPRG
ncbi:MAG: hypothetical protein ACRCYV_04260 [Aeromonas sp.]